MPKSFPKMPALMDYRGIVPAKSQQPGPGSLGVEQVWLRSAFTHGRAAHA